MSRTFLLDIDFFLRENGRSFGIALIEVVEKLLAKLPLSNSESFCDSTPSFWSLCWVSIRVFLNLSAIFAIVSLAYAAVKFFFFVLTWTELYRLLGLSFTALLQLFKESYSDLARFPLLF